MSNFENMTYEGVIRFVIREMVQAGATRLQASTIQLYLADHHGVRCNLATIEAVMHDLDGTIVRVAPCDHAQPPETPGDHRIGSTTYEREAL